MKILHTSDWHIGRTLHGVDLGPAISLFCDWLVQTVHDQGVDLVLISGDVYDRAIPSTDAIRLFNDVVMRLSQMCTVVVTSGNHDSATRLGSLAPMLRDELQIFTDMEQVGEPFVFTSAEGEEALIYPLPYLEPEIARYSLGRRLAVLDGGDPSEAEPVERSHQATVDAALRMVEADLVERRTAGVTVPAVLMLHAFITGGNASDSERYIAVGGVEDVRSASFDLSADFHKSGMTGLAYVAAGHLHRPQDIVPASMPIRYSGSPVAYSFSEAGATKSVTVVTLSASGVESIEHLPTPVWRPLAVIEGGLDEVLGEGFAHLRDHFVSVTITDAERPAGLNERIRSVFPYALLISHRSSRDIDLDRAPTIREKVSDEHICTSFFEEVGGRALNAEELAVLHNLLADSRLRGMQA